MSADTVPVCPECDTTDVNRLSKDPRGGTPDDTYSCQRCPATFDTPAERERHHTATGHNGVGAKLLDADPEAWP